MPGQTWKEANAARQYRVLTDAVIVDHLSGRITAGLYPMLADGTCRLLVCDFDDEWQLDAQAYLGQPKSAASRRTIALDRQTVRVLRAHRSQQRQWCRDTGRFWRESGYMFVHLDGQPYHPNFFTHRLRTLTAAAGLPPVRLHDLRHGAASLAHTTGADLKTVQDQLGHASIVLTADTYTSVLPAAQHRAAEATARLVLAAARDAGQKINRKRRDRPAARAMPHRPPQTSAATAPRGSKGTGNAAAYRDTPGRGSPKPGSAAVNNRRATTVRTRRTPAKK